MATNRAPISGPWVASQAKTRLDTGLMKAPMTMVRIRPRRATDQPPTKTPTVVAMTPKTLRTSASSVLVNPRSR
ncbi:hypothetical protein D3C80_1593230 [compost metagenome]